MVDEEEGQPAKDFTKGEEVKANLLVAGTPALTTADIHAAFKQIQSEDTA